MLESWRVIGSTITYEDRWLKIRSDRCVTPTGEVIDPYHVLEYPPLTNVVALTAGGEIVLVREYRHGAGEILVGLPGGAVEPGELPEAAIRRELYEETGFGGGEVWPIGQTYANPANANNVAWSFLAVGVREGRKPALGANEQTEVMREPFLEFMKWTWQGRIQLHAWSVATLHFALNAILRGQQPLLAELRRGLSTEILGAAE